MEFVEVMKIDDRMCDYYDRIECCKCPLGRKNNGKRINCPTFVTAYPEEAEKIIMKWAEEHPIKTNGLHFIEEFPNAYVSGRKYNPNEMVYIHLNRPGSDADGIYFPAEWWDSKYEEVSKDADSN